jgi:NAD(P)-dependent dehydrogenase (short-subunit alcohol dehydrogenase family)
VWWSRSGNPCASCRSSAVVGAELGAGAGAATFEVPRSKAGQSFVMLLFGRATSRTGRGVVMLIPRRLDDHVAVITGAAHGVGLAICRELADLGAIVIAIDRDEGVTTVLRGPWADAFRLDVRDEAAVQRAVTETVRHHGRVDALVNCAGKCRISRFLDDSPEQWTEILSVNLVGAYTMMRAVCPVMQRQSPRPDTGCRGKIVNISSPAARYGRPMTAAYGASKAALDHLTMSAAAALGDAGISSTVVNPGDVYDGMWKRLAEEFSAIEDRPVAEVIEQRLRTVPRQRFQDPDEVAAPVAFVLSYVGMGLNGQTVWTDAHVTAIR